MLADLLALDRASTKKVGTGTSEISGSINSAKNIESKSQFSKILSSLDETSKFKSNLKGAENFQSLQELFEDDKEFLKDAISLLTKGDSNSKNGSFQTTVKKQSSKLELEQQNNQDVISSNLNKEAMSLFGLNLGNFKISNASDEAFKVTINQAKDFLKNELKKMSIPETEMPQSLRGLVELASSKGIGIKDVKYSDNKNNNLIAVPTNTDNDLSNNSTDNLLRNRSMAFILKAGITDQTPQNLTAQQNQQTLNLSADKLIQQNQTFDLSSALQNVETQPVGLNQPVNKNNGKTSTSSLNLNKEVSSLTDILAVKNEIGESKAVKNIQNTGAIDKIAKFTGIDAPILNSLFSEEELKDLGISGLSSLDKTVSLSSNSTDNLSGIGLAQSKDNLDLKIGEAKTMTRHLAQNLKEQVENYKSPFQKLSLTLNPERLGEVDVDIIKRGNSVKITLSSSTQTIGILSAYAPELRNQLVSAGLENPTFKFNEDGRGNNNGDRREERKQNQNKNDETSNIFEINLEENVA